MRATKSLALSLAYLLVAIGFVLMLPGFVFVALGNVIDEAWGR